MEAVSTSQLFLIIISKCERLPKSRSLAVCCSGGGEHKAIIVPGQSAQC